MNTKLKAVLSRFLRAFVSGFLSVAVTVSFAGIGTWGDFGMALDALILASTIGGFSGLIMALEKYYRWEE